MARILIADDDIDERDLIIFALRFAGYKVLSAADRAEIVSLAPENRPDLILMDADLYKSNGNEKWSSSIKDRADIPATLILLVDQGQEVNLKADLDFISRPISLDRLTRKVNDTLKVAKR